MTKSHDQLTVPPEISQPANHQPHPAIARRVIIAFVFFVIALTAFSIIGYQVREGMTLGFDRSVLLWIHGWAPSSIAPFIIALTTIGGPFGTVIMTVILATYLWLRRRKHAAIVIIASVGGAALMNLFLKSFFERARPDLWTRLVHEASFSFPSGHAMASSALMVALGVVAWQTRWRWSAIIFGIGYVLIIGFTRLYLGVHYPSDIVGGWTVSVTWVTIVSAVVAHTLEKRSATMAK